MAKKEKCKLEIGNVYAVPLNDGRYAFGVLCHGNEVNFFDYTSIEMEIPSTLLDMGSAFRVPVAKDELENCCWEIIGRVDLPGQYSTPGKYLHKPVGSSQYYLYSAGKSLPVLESEVRGLEVLSVWFSSHIVERLQCFFKGEKSKYDVAIGKQLGIPF